MSINGNFTNEDFTSSDFYVTKQINSSYKMNTDSLKYSNGYIDDIYVDIIEGNNVITSISI